MKYLIVVFMVLALSCLSLFAQTTPPPTEAPEIKYEAQICWGAITEDKWQDIEITYNVVVGQVTAKHKYNGKLGMQIWEAAACNDTTSKVVFNFDILSIPDNLKFWYYYIRLRGYTEIGEDRSPGSFSDASEWLSIHDIGKPSKPVGK